MAPRPGFEPGSKPRQGFMIGHYTIGAGLGTTTVLYFNRSRNKSVVVSSNAIWFYSEKRGIIHHPSSAAILYG